MPPHPLSPLRSVLAWPVASQQRSRRNAMIASTALAERRRERLDAEQFLSAHERRHEARLHRGGHPDGTRTRVI